MYRFIFFILILMFTAMGCDSPSKSNSETDLEISSPYSPTKGALLSTRFKTFEDLKSVVKIEYLGTDDASDKNDEVRLTHSSNGHQVIAILKSGISDKELRAARDGSLWDRIMFVTKVPYLATKRNDLIRVFNLARRRGYLFGDGDLAFYDLAEKMFYNINDNDLVSLTADDLSEKGYINTFNHITAQALLTTLFSEYFTDYLADMHERGNMAELVTGKFTNEQLADRQKGPIDNYVDIINNEWGQELGKVLKEKHGINRHTLWTNELTANYLNDLQSYYSWAFQIGFKPFKEDDFFVENLAIKINTVMGDISGYR